LLLVLPDSNPRSLTSFGMTSKGKTVIPQFVWDDSGLVSSRGRFHGRGISLLVLSGSNPKFLLTSPQDDRVKSFSVLCAQDNNQPEACALIMSF